MRKYTYILIANNSRPAYVIHIRVMRRSPTIDIRPLVYEARVRRRKEKRAYSGHNQVVIDWSLKHHSRMLFYRGFIDKVYK